MYNNLTLKSKMLLTIFTLLGILAFSFPLLERAFRLNSITLIALKAAFSPEKALSQADVSTFLQAAPSDCHLSWLVDRFQTADQQQTSFMGAFACSPEYLHIAAKSSPIDLELALKATQAYPESVDAWMWLAFSQEYARENSGLAGYQKVVELDSRNGNAWCAIGDISARLAQIAQAETAYQNCCKNQDPGGGGCYGAGQMAEKLGDTQLAIQYYRLSDSDNARLRLNELEKLRQP